MSYAILYDDGTMAGWYERDGVYYLLAEYRAKRPHHQAQVIASENPWPIVGSWKWAADEIIKEEKL